MSNTMKNPKKESPNKIQNLISRYIPFHFISNNTKKNTSTLDYQYKKTSSLTTSSNERPNIMITSNKVRTNIETEKKELKATTN